MLKKNTIRDNSDFLEQSLTGGWISYFSGAVIKHPDQGNLWKKDIILARNSRRVRVYDGRRHSTKQQAWEQQQKASNSQLEVQQGSGASKLEMA